MRESISESAREFAGYMDGFRARNLASMHSKIRGQLADMEAWLAMLRTSVPDELPESAEFNKIVTEMSAAFRDSKIPIANRLIYVSGFLVSMITLQANFVRTRSEILSQLNNFIYSFLDAAEVSGSQELFEAAGAVAEAYKKLLT